MSTQPFGNGPSLRIEKHRHLLTTRDCDTYEVTRVVNTEETITYRLSADHDDAAGLALHVLATSRFTAKSCIDSLIMQSRYFTVPAFHNGHPNNDPDDWLHLEAFLEGFSDADRVRIFEHLGG